jgi:diaminohydroxyphosphoribosylaminopyrimidine deaminase/5-amino-6-(5-phosphoribosylamino)uracil reductase
MVNHELYMSRCIQLALRGEGRVAPNPLVGALLVHNDRVVAEGYHEFFGGPHAEVNAINSLEDKSILSECTIYVTLEPCSHQGKTPPCSNLIVESGIRKVVIGSSDTNAEVNGRGMRSLRKNGVEVIENVLVDECRELNKFFFTYHEKKRPYVLLKWAQSQTGYLDRNFERTKISSAESKTLVHQWRHSYQSILVGRKTAETDDPSLTVREIEGVNPIRIILDPHLKLSEDLQVFNNEARTIILNVSDEKENRIKLRDLEVKTVLNALYDLGINSVLVEGGGDTLSRFIDADLWDEAKVFVADLNIEQGTKAPVITERVPEVEQFFNDKLLTYFNK